ncbi:MAG: cyclic pyranopterin monophosphate synthase MoaC [Thermodesulfobacteriota bacterium]
MDDDPLARLSHFDPSGQARMVDVGGKLPTVREAVAAGTVTMSPEAFALLASGQIGKGDVLGVARLAGIMAAKRVDTLIPLAHTVPLTSVGIRFALDEAKSQVQIEASARAEGRTGVEMEALTAVSVAALTIYDMCKAADRSMVIDQLRLVRKTGGKSGTYTRPA